MQDESAQAKFTHAYSYLDQLASHLVTVVVVVVLVVVTMYHLAYINRPRAALIDVRILYCTPSRVFIVYAPIS